MRVSLLSNPEEQHRTFWRRITALILDICLLTPLILLTPLSMDFAEALPDWFTRSWPFAYVLLFHTYFAALHWKPGQTAGEFLAGVKIFTSDREPLSFLHAVRREFPPFILCVMLILALSLGGHSGRIDVLVAVAPVLFLTQLSWAVLDLLPAQFNQTRQTLIDHAFHTTPIRRPAPHLSRVLVRICIALALPVFSYGYMILWQEHRTRFLPAFAARATLFHINNFGGDPPSTLHLGVRLNNAHNRPLAFSRVTLNSVTTSKGHNLLRDPLMVSPESPFNPCSFTLNTDHLYLPYATKFDRIIWIPGIAEGSTSWTVGVGTLPLDSPSAIRIRGSVDVWEAGDSQSAFVPNVAIAEGSRFFFDGHPVTIEKVVPSRHSGAGRVIYSFQGEDIFVEAIEYCGIEVDKRTGEPVSVILNKGNVTSTRRTDWRKRVYSVEQVTMAPDDAPKYVFEADELPGMTHADIRVRYFTPIKHRQVRLDSSCSAAFFRSAPDASFREPSASRYSDRITIPGPLLDATSSASFETSFHAQMMDEPESQQILLTMTHTDQPGMTLCQPVIISVIDNLQNNLLHPLPCTSDSRRNSGIQLIRPIDKGRRQFQVTLQMRPSRKAESLTLCGFVIFGFGPSPQRMSRFRPPHMFLDFDSPLQRWAERPFELVVPLTPEEPSTTNGATQ